VVVVVDNFSTILVYDGRGVVVLECEVVTQQP